MEEEVAYLYAFKYHNIACEIDGERFVLSKFGMVKKKWTRLMNRFLDHQSGSTRTFGIYPHIPKHTENATNAVALYDRNYRENRNDGVLLSGVESVIEAIKNDYIGGLYKDEEDRELRTVWPDLAYIVPTPRSHAKFMEGVVPWGLVTFLDQDHLKEQLDRMHRIRFPGARSGSSVSHTESFLLSQTCFDSLRQLFLTGTFNMNTLCQLTREVRPCPTEETEEVILEWRMDCGNRRTMPVRYYKPLYSPETAESRPNLALLAS